RDPERRGGAPGGGSSPHHRRLSGGRPFTHRNGGPPRGALRTAPRERRGALDRRTGPRRRGEARGLVDRGRRTVPRPDASGGPSTRVRTRSRGAVGHPAARAPVAEAYPLSPFLPKRGGRLALRQPRVGAAAGGHRLLHARWRGGARGCGRT